MPESRQPLRERCNVKLTVKTFFPTGPNHGTSADNNTTSLDEYIKAYKQFQDSRMFKRKWPYINATDGPHLYPLAPTAVHGLNSLHQLVPYLFVSFYEGLHLPHSLIAADGTVFTHIIKITYETHKRKAGATQLLVDRQRGLYTLILIIPAPMPDNAQGGRNSLNEFVAENTAGLTEYQMLVARDFLSLALPYHSQAHPRNDIPNGPADCVRVLVTATARDNAAVHIMSIAVCYLSFASEECAQTVLGYIQAEEVPHVWRECLGEKSQGMKIINRVAMMGE